MLGCSAVDWASIVPGTGRKHAESPRRDVLYGEVLVAITNENEYNAFVNNKKNEALKDRMILVKVTDLQHLAV
ncbi:MAG TPA: hypothetical protein VEC99_11630 [Clostridia bacterium]|nr:hypothetical protein [Clostridia bacterium]